MIINNQEYVIIELLSRIITDFSKFNKIGSNGLLINISEK